MATLTIRNLDDGVHKTLRVRAAENGRSMEAEARAILAEAAAVRAPPDNLARRIHELFLEVGGVEPEELRLPERAPPREPPRFD